MVQHIDKTLLGQVLIEQNVITNEDLEKALEYRDTHGGLLGTILLDLSLITEQQLIHALIEQDCLRDSSK